MVESAAVRIKWATWDGDMSVARSHAMSMAEFLAWEECQELKQEFDGFEPVVMAGVSLVHVPYRGGGPAAVAVLSVNRVDTLRRRSKSKHKYTIGCDIAPVGGTQRTR